MGGKRWTQEELKILLDLSEAGMSPEQILETGKLPNRGYRSILEKMRRLKVGSFAPQKKKFFAPQITPKDVLSLEEVLKRWGHAYKRICDMKELDKLQLERMRILFMAAGKYARLLAAYERMSEVEERLERLEAMVEEICRKG